MPSSVRQHQVEHDHVELLTRGQLLALEAAAANLRGKPCLLQAGLIPRAIFGLSSTTAARMVHLGGPDRTTLMKAAIATASVRLGVPPAIASRGSPIATPAHFLERSTPSIERRAELVSHRVHAFSIRAIAVSRPVHCWSFARARCPENMETPCPTTDHPIPAASPPDRGGGRTASRRST